MPHRGKVYVIDDDEAMRDSLNFLLDSANFNVTLFETALKFLDALPGLEFGCVVSDVRMPGLDGIELLKRMKAGHSRFPIVIMTGHGDVPLAVEAMKQGAVDFLEKPFEDDRLIGMIEAVVLERLLEKIDRALFHCFNGKRDVAVPGHDHDRKPAAVSYTHLTLPTNREV